MKLQINKFRIFSYLLPLVLFIGFSCSSDDNTIMEDDPISGESSFTMKIDGEPWGAHVAHVQTYGGPEWWEEGDEEVYLVAISASKHEDGTDGAEVEETFTIHIFVDPSDFNNPIGVYTVPPSTDMQAGAAAAYYTTKNTSFLSVDPENENRKVGEVAITSFELGQQIALGMGYINLTGTFEFEIYGANITTGALLNRTITEGSFNIKNLGLD